MGFRPDTTAPSANTEAPPGVLTFDFDMFHQLSVQVDPDGSIANAVYAGEDVIDWKFTLDLFDSASMLLSVVTVNGTEQYQVRVVEGSESSEQRLEVTGLEMEEVADMVEA